MKMIYENLPEIEFIKQPTQKELIVLHHTVSSSGQFVDDWWKKDNGTSRVAVSFIVEKDGTVTQLFDPAYWAYHIGKGSNDLHNKRSIGIEIVNEGLLTCKVEGNQTKYFWLDGKHEFKGNVFKCQKLWRGSYYFAHYTEEQVQAVAELVKKLCEQLNIPKSILTDFEYMPGYLMHKGIASHHNLRADKSDVSPAFPLQRLMEMIA